MTQPAKAKPCLQASVIVGVFLLAVSFKSQAVLPPSDPPLPNFDKRRDSIGTRSALSAEQQAALEQLHSRLPGSRVDFDPVVGAPRRIFGGEGFLSGANGIGNAVSPAAAVGLAANDPNRATKAFLRDHSRLFGHGPEILNDARVEREFTSAHNGLRTVVWQQQEDGVRVFGALLISHTTRQGELVTLSSQFVPDPRGAANRGVPDRAGLLRAPPISAARAVAFAAANLGETTLEADLAPVQTARSALASDTEKRQQFRGAGIKGEAETKLVWLPLNKNKLQLCWEVLLISRSRNELYRVLVNAETGEPLVRHCLTFSLADATYRVFTSDSPSPFSPGHPTPLTTQPPKVSRSLVTLSALDTTASPGGWIDDGGNETLGNNVDAHTDRTDDDLPDLPRPQGSPFRVFDFPLDLNQDPTSYSEASVVQLFYWVNWAHDRMYELGFTESAGNFQNDNFGRGGLGNDRVLADAQDGGAFNNANIFVYPDGTSPRIQMYLWSGANPDLDGSLDAEVILHEYTHGLSNRRVGGGAFLTEMQSMGMGEGWSDFYALAMLSEPGDDLSGNYALAAYIDYLLPCPFAGNPPQTRNYYYGLRRFPYSTDMSKNPLTLVSVVGNSYNMSVPNNTQFVPGPPWEVHNLGEIWCVTLCEARANLIRTYGWAVGNELILRLVTDAMNLSPPNPNFLEARDAILLADQVNGGSNRYDLWNAFAKRGMGFNAYVPDSLNVIGTEERFDLPGLGVSPRNGFVARGPVGGPFVSNSVTYSLINAGTNALNWTCYPTTPAPWLQIIPTNGTLQPGDPPATVTVSLTSAATNLPGAIYRAALAFKNLNTSVLAYSTNALLVAQPDAYTELFNANDNDLAFHTLTFTPDGTENFYSLCVEPADGFPVDPAGGTVFWGEQKVILTNLTVSFYGTAYQKFWVNPNGRITFLDRDRNHTETVSGHFEQPGVSVLFHPLTTSVYPPLAYMSWKQLLDRVVVTYVNVHAEGSSLPNNFQLEMFADGRIRMTYLELNCPNALAGLSPGEGVPPYFIETDLSGFPCSPVPTIFRQPVSQLLHPGANLILHVDATGAQALKYRWRKDGVNLSNGARVAGATNESLIISNIVDGDAGQYTVLVTNNYGQALSSNAMVQVSGLDHFAWNHIPSPQSAHIPFMVTVRALDGSNVLVTNFSDTVTLTGWAFGGLPTGTILASPSPTSESYLGLPGITLGYSFTPNTDLTVTHFRHFSGSPISIWTQSGTLLVSQNVTNVPGTWTETALNKPIQLTAGTRYRVGAYYLNAFQYWRSDLGGTFPYGTIDEGWSWAGDPYPFAATGDFDRWHLVDLRYVVGPLPILPVVPTVSANFTQGVWTGSVVVPQPASDFALGAEDALHHAGLSEVIQIVSAPKLELNTTVNPSLILWPAGAPQLVLETSTNLSSPDWIPVQVAPQQIGDQYGVPIDFNSPTRFYRLRYSP